MKLFRQHLKHNSQTQRKPGVNKTAELRKRRDPIYRGLMTQSGQEIQNVRRVNSFTIHNNMSTISTLTKQMDTINSKVFCDAQHELEVKLRPQLNGYLLNKFRKLVESGGSARRKGKSAFTSDNPEISNTISFDPIQNDSYFSCGSCCKTVKKVNGNEGVLVNNAKERVLRLVELKIAKEGEFKSVTDTVRRRCLKTEKKRRAKNVQVKMDRISGEEWDRQWRNDISLQLKRYRTRVTTLSRKEQRLKLNLEKCW